MKITKEEVEHVALLARLRLTGDEKELYSNQLDKILSYMEKLSELNTDGVEPTTHAVPITNPYRDDRVSPSIPRDKALQNAPQKEKGCFKVPRIIEEG